MLERGIKPRFSYFNGLKPHRARAYVLWGTARQIKELRGKLADTLLAQCIGIKRVSLDWKRQPMPVLRAGQYLHCFVFWTGAVANLADVLRSCAVGVIWPFVFGSCVFIKKAHTFIFPSRRRKKSPMFTIGSAILDVRGNQRRLGALLLSTTIILRCQRQLKITSGAG